MKHSIFITCLFLLCISNALAEYKKDILINEVCNSNIDQWIDPSFNYGSWVELYNPTSIDIDITGWYLSDDRSNLRLAKIIQKTVIPARGFTTLWFDHYDPTYSPSNINMKLDYDGGCLYLSDNNGNLVTFEEYPIAISRSSWARTTDGEVQWNYCVNPSPSESNNFSSFSDQRLLAPEIDIDSHTFSSGSISFNVSIPSGCTLYYTTDGSTPSLTNGQISFTGAFSTSETTYYRFRLYSDGYLPSPVVTRTFIKHDMPIDLPILSVIGTHENFYGDSLGIFARGVNGIPGRGVFYNANWNMDWERPGVFEYFTANGDALFGQEVGITRAGGWSRSWEPWTFKIKANKRYEGLNNMSFPFFAEKPYLKHKTLLVRNGGNDSIGYVKDAFLQQIIATSGIDVDYQAYQPVAHFVNGVWKGIINLREPSNKHFVYANYGLGEDEIDMYELAGDSGYVQMCGDKGAFDEIVELSKTAEDSSVYEQICERLDIDEFINYLALELYLRNSDWPFNNVKGWRPRLQNGRYRYIVFDLDFIDFTTTASPFKFFEDNNTFTYTNIYVEPWVYIPKEVELVTFTLNLFKNETFRRKFIDAFCMMAYNIFDPERCRQLITQMGERVARTQSLYQNNTPWRSANQLISSLSQTRQSNLMSHMKAYSRLKLSDAEMRALELSANIDNAKIYFNEIEVPSSSYKGRFYSPANVRAIAPAGYSFKGWKQLITTTETIIETKGTWKYYDKGSLNNTSWQLSSYDDSAWSSGTAPLGYSSNNKDISTILNFGSNKKNRRPTYYFRSSFDLSTIETLNDSNRITLSYAVNDGFIIYLNGTEIYRYNLPPGDIQYATYASGDCVYAPDKGTLDLPNSLLQAGTNIIAVEVHNSNASSADVYWSAYVSRIVTADGPIISTDNEFTLPESSDIRLRACFEEDSILLSKLPPIVINEISADNDVYLNDQKKKSDWIELYNTTSQDINLSGLYLTDKIKKPQKWQIIAENPNISTILPAHGYKIIWCDGQTASSDLHAPFKLGNEDGSYVMISADDGSWSDTLSYCAHQPFETVGRYPDASRNVYLMTRSSIAKTNQLTSYSSICPQVFADSLTEEDNHDEFALTVLPFAYTTDTHVALTLSNASDLTSISFDIVLPKSLSLLHGIAPLLSTSKFKTASVMNPDSTIHVTINAKSLNRLASSKGTDIARLTLSYDKDIPSDVHTITLQNILMTDTSGKAYKAKPFTTEIFIGPSPKITPINGVAAFHGDYGGAAEYALLKTSLPEGATIDLTEISAFAENPSNLISDNVIYTNDTISYGRLMSSKWGTTCLPFPVESKDSLQFYTLTTVTDDAMTFKKISSVEAFTPVLYKSGTGQMLVKQCNDGTLPIFFSSSNVQDLSQIQSVSGWIMNGTFTDETLNVNDISAYTLINDNFCKVTKTLHIMAFRAWFQNNGIATGMNFRIEESNEFDDLRLIEQEDGTVELYYDLHGRRQQSQQPNQITISVDQKSLNK